MIGSPVQVHQTTDILRLFEESAIAAGRVILDIYRAGAKVRIKGDKSPVTEADEAAERLILEALANGKPVVTANKELLANVGAELYAAADAAGRDDEVIPGHDGAVIEAIPSGMYMPCTGQACWLNAESLSLASDTSPVVTARRSASSFALRMYTKLPLASLWIADCGNIGATAPPATIRAEAKPPGRSALSNDSATRAMP